MNRPTPLTHRPPRSVLAVLTLALGVAAGLAGCGGGGEGEAGTAEPVSQVKPAAAPAAPTAEGQGTMKMVSYVVFEPKVLDFGTVSPNKELSGTITMRNSGTEPVTIVAMKPSCKCTTVEDLSGETLGPGETRTINAVMDKRAYPGPRNSKIDFIFADGSQHRYDITSVVAMAIEAVPSYINAVDYQSGEYVVRAQDDKPFRILSVNEREPNFIDFDPRREEPRTEYRLAWDVSGYDLKNCMNPDGDPMRLWWVIETDREDVPVLDMRMRHNPCTRLESPINGRRWFLTDNRVLLGTLTPGVQSEFEMGMKFLQNRVDPTVTIKRVTLDGNRPKCDVELLSVTGIGEDMVIRVGVTPRSDATGLIYEPIRLHGNMVGQSHVVVVIGRIPAEG